jgi:hypothetical protein
MINLSDGSAIIFTIRDYFIPTGNFLFINNLKKKKKKKKKSIFALNYLQYL